MTEQHERLCDSLPTPPPQFPRDLRAAPTLPGLANPPLEGVRQALDKALCTESIDQFALNSQFTLLFQIFRTAQLRLSLTFPRPHPLGESQAQLSPVVTKCGSRGARWCAV